MTLLFASIRPLRRALAVAAIFAALVGPARCEPAAVPASSPETVKITIVHTNDMHGHVVPEVDKKVAASGEKVGGAAYLAGLINKLRAENPTRTIVIDAGDIAQGTPISNLFQGRPVLEYMDLVGYDVGTIGNHEFDWGPAAMTAMVRGTKHPVVCANLIEVSTGKLPAGVQPFIIRTIDGVRVGITGVVTPTTPEMSFERNVKPYRFISEVASMQATLPRMRKAGAQVIVVVSHLGEKADRALAAAVKGIDVIVGGHSHTALFDPVVVNGTAIVQAGRYMRYAGRMDLIVDRKAGKVIDFTRKDELVPVIDAKITPDAKVAVMVEGYEKKVAPAMAQVVGETSVDLVRNPAAGQGDSPLGDVVTDALRWKGSADVAVYNAGGIRSDFNKGAISVGDVYTLLPFDNYVVTLTLTGEQVARLLTQGITNDHGVVQVSGATFRVAEGKAADIRVGGEPLDPKKVYKIATVDFLADGGDGFTVFKEGKNRVTDELARDAFTAYVRSNTPLKAPTTGRITKPSAP